MSLMPERPLTVSPQLAATLGLEEALLYQLLGDCRAFAGGGEWCRVSCARLLELLPFWDAGDVRRVSNSLAAKGVLAVASAPFGEEAEFRFALVGSGDGASARAQPPRRNLMGDSWQPAPDIVAQLGQYGIPEDFIQQQVAEFVAYWSERGEPRHAWNARFLKHTLRRWREEESRQARRSREVPMTSDWRPSADAVELLNRQSGVHLNFIEDAIPEFILYWRERGDCRSTWNSDFVRHVRMQWARYTAALEHDSEPRVIARDWEPSEDLYEVLELANIPREFAERQIPEFVLFWRENGQALNSWNTKFLQHVKRQWARHAAGTDTSHERHQQTGETVRTRDRSLIEDLTDRSWAN